MQEERRTRTWEAPAAPGGEDPTAVGSTAPEARQGKPGHRTLLEPTLCGGAPARQAETSRPRDPPPAVPGVSYHAEDSEAGKARYTGKDMTEVRSPHRPLLPDTVGSDHQQPTSRQGLANKAQRNKQPRFRELYRGLDADRLLACWRALKKQAASGVDGRTAPASAVTRQANSTALAQRLPGKRSRTTRVRRCSIPQENGTERPRGMPALEDQLGQPAGAKLLMALYEQDCLDWSDGDRPGRGAVEAVRDLTCDRQYGPYGYLVEADIHGCFDQLDHRQLVPMRRERSDDRALLRLLCTGLQAGMLATDGHVVQPETGSPQGGCSSPVLANVYWPDVLDGWLDTVVKAHCRGEALLCR
jgi:RNA-directed DNA polymerase